MSDMFMLFALSFFVSPAFGKDLRVTEGDPYTEVREYDFSSYYPVENYIKKQAIPEKNIYNINDYGADTAKADNAPFINATIDAAQKTAELF